MSIPLVVGLGEVLWDMLPAGRQLGGAPANFAYHAAALGARGVVVSRVGDDEPGREIFARLDALGLDRRHVGVDARHPTGRVDVRVDAHGVPAYVIHEPVAWDLLATDDSLLDLARRADAVCFGTLAQRSSRSRESIRGFVRATRRSCLRIFDINLRQSYYSREIVDESLRAADVLKLNDSELPVVTELLGITATDASTASRVVMARYALRLVALTRGPRGSMLLARDGTADDHPGFPATQLADTVGAGDAFTAAVVLGLLAGRPLDRINAAANRLAAHVCTQPGATPPIPALLVSEVTAA